MLNVCTGSGRNRHDDIVFQGINCPLCSETEAHEQTTSNLRDANDKLQELDCRIAELEKEAVAEAIGAR